MTIQVITSDNGWGLSKDIQVLREALPQHEIIFTPHTKPRHGHTFNWNIHLELLNPAHFRSSRINVFIPNPEWTQAVTLRHLNRVDLIIAKTRDTARIFDSLHRNVKYTGWTSPDTEARVDHSTRNIVHLAGGSSGKGTNAVVEAAALIPHVPIRIVKHMRPSRHLPANVTWTPHRMEEKDFREMQRAPIHLCPSTYEGFGHYINEARSMGATIVTTGAEPMMELVNERFGFLCPVAREDPNHMAMDKHVDVAHLAKCIEMAHEYIGDHGQLWGDRARQAYVDGREEFTRLINEVVK